MFEKDCDTFPEEPDTLGEHVSFLHSKDNLKSHLDGFKSSGASFWKTSWAIHGCLILLYTTFSACIIFILGFEREVAEVNRNGEPIPFSAKLFAEYGSKQHFLNYAWSTHIFDSL